MKVALVHDYLKEYGGAERVLEALHEIFPKAPVYIAYFTPSGLGPHAKRFSDWDIRTSWLQRVPFANRLISPFRIFAPMIFESFDMSEYDLVISSCAIYFSKAVITKPGSLHISYIHTPPRYLYGYTTSFNYKKNPVTKILGEIANHFLRIYDFETSQRPDILVANSKNVADRIKKFYRRDSVVIYPPVELGKRVKRKGEKEYFLSVGRLVRGKGMDTVVEACVKLGLPLKVVGSGPELENLKRLLRPPLQVLRSRGPQDRGARGPHNDVQFLGQVSDEELPGLYAGAKATVLASEDEDFGIVAVESQACGTPVIAPKEGGFLETVDQKTGILYGVDRGQITVDSLAEVLKDFNPDKFKAEDLRKQAEKFSKMRFKKEILELVKRELDKFSNP
ncbi:MAG: glycosyltransferase [Patescibacteria group bacterium]